MRPPPRPIYPREVIGTYHPLRGTAEGPAEVWALPRAGPGTTRLVRTLAVCGVVAALYALGAELTFLLPAQPAAGLAFFPAAGVTLAALLLVEDRRVWPAILATIAVAEMSVDVAHGQPLTMALGFAAANALEPFVSASLLLRRDNALDLDRPDTLRRFVAIAVIVGPCIGALVGATTSALHGATDSWLSSFGRWWAGDALGVLAVATPILVITQRARQVDRESIPVAESVLIGSGAIALAVASLFVWSQTPLYAVALVLVLVALRCGLAVVATVGFAVAAVADAATASGHGQYVVLAQGDTQLAMLFLQVFLGLTLLTTFMLAAEASQRRRVESELARAEAERFRTFATSLEERNHIAGEVHDIVGHTLNVVVLQAGAARRMMPSDPVRSVEMLHTVEETARGGLRELDLALRAVGPRDPVVDENGGLTDVPRLVTAMQDAGVRVELHTEGEPCPVAALTDRSAFRVVQEALTNVLKHAGLAHVVVTVRYTDDEVCVEVVDDGDGTRPEPAVSTGRGLLGMRERVAALGGTLASGRRPEGGYRVRAHFPVQA
jgi:signal transduction histidine kinase